MAQHQLAVTDSSADWITEFDAVDPTYDLSPFALTLLGRLPTELLAMIVWHLSRRDLAKIARASHKLLELAQRSLYSDILIPYWVTDMNHRGQEVDTDELQDGRWTLWLLHNTLVERPDLAKKVKTMDILATSHNILVDTKTSSIFPSGLPFATKVSFKIAEAIVVGAILHLLPEVDVLTIQYVKIPVRCQYDRYISPPAGCCVFAMFPGMSDHKQHLSPPLVLPKLTRLEWWCSDFH
jgi:hypothetical protein